MRADRASPSPSLPAPGSRRAHANLRRFPRMLAGLVALALLAPDGAIAHVDTVSQGRVAAREGRLEISLAIDVDRVMEMGEAPPPTGEDWTDAEFAAVEPRAFAYVESHHHVLVDGKELELTRGRMTPLVAQPPGARVPRSVQLSFEFSAPRPSGDLRLKIRETLLIEN